jgi:hypothetical protein
MADDKRDHVMQRARDALGARTYVTFMQGLPPDGEAAPDQLTCGPYVKVAVQDSIIMACGTDGPFNCDFVILATREGGGWKVHDGLEDTSPVWPCVMFGTTAK